jgi:hypothetical protein
MYIPHIDMASNADIRKPKGLKDHKGALEDNAAAKRSAAAAAAKFKTTNSPVTEAQAAPGDVENANQISITPHEDVAPHGQITTAEPSSAAVASFFLRSTLTRGFQLRNWTRAPAPPSILPQMCLKRRPMSPTSSSRSSCPRRM